MRLHNFFFLLSIFAFSLLLSIGWYHVSNPSLSYSSQQDCSWMTNFIYGLGRRLLETIRAMNHYLHSHSFSLSFFLSHTHHLRSRLPNALKKPSCALHAEKKNWACRYIPSDKNLAETLPIRRTTSEQRNTSYMTWELECYVRTFQFITICHRALAQFPRLPQSTWYLEETGQQVKNNGGQQQWIKGFWQHRRELTERCTICGGSEEMRGHDWPSDLAAHS